MKNIQQLVLVCIALTGLISCNRFKTKTNFKRQYKNDRCSKLEKG